MTQQPCGVTPPPSREFRGLAHILSARLFDDVAVEVCGSVSDRRHDAGSDLASRFCRDRITESHRFETDLARVEQALGHVTAAAHGDAPRGANVPLPVTGDGWRRAELEPIGPLSLVTLPWRLLPWTRKLERPAPVPAVPRRGLRHLLVYAREGAATHRDGPPTLHWESLSGGEGHLLSLILHGTPLGRAVDHSVARGWVGDVPAALALLGGWITAGLFAGVGSLPA